MPTKFDDAIAALKAEHYKSPEQLQILELLVAQNERIKNLEHFHLEVKSRLGVAEAKQVEHEQSIASLAKTRDEHEVQSQDHRGSAREGQGQDRGTRQARHHGRGRCRFEGLPSRRPASCERRAQPAARRVAAAEPDWLASGELTRGQAKG